MRIVYKHVPVYVKDMNKPFIDKSKKIHDI